LGKPFGRPGKLVLLRAGSLLTTSRLIPVSGISLPAPGKFVI
jgi:hypothetical protein